MPTDLISGDSFRLNEGCCRQAAFSGYPIGNPFLDCFSATPNLNYSLALVCCVCNAVTLPTVPSSCSLTWPEESIFHWCNMPSAGVKAEGRSDSNGRRTNEL